MGLLKFQITLIIYTVVDDFLRKINFLNPPFPELYKLAINGPIQGHEIALD